MKITVAGNVKEYDEGITVEQLIEANVPVCHRYDQ